MATHSILHASHFSFDIRHLIIYYFYKSVVLRLIPRYGFLVLFRFSIAILLLSLDT